MITLKKGYSLRANKLFELDFTDFPCLVLFRDIRAREFLTIRLQALSVDEISLILRQVFSVIAKADDPLLAVAQFQKKEQIKKAGKVVIGEVKTLANMTFETVIKSLVEASIS